MEIYLIVFILFDNYDLTFIYVCMYFVCYQNKQDTLAGECFPVSNRTNTFDIVQLDTVSLFNLSFQIFVYFITLLLYSTILIFAIFYFKRLWFLLYQFCTFILI